MNEISKAYCFYFYNLEKVVQDFIPNFQVFVRQLCTTTHQLWMGSMILHDILKAKENV
jgi:hypothetical protein